MPYYYCGDFELNVCTGFQTTKKSNRKAMKSHSLLDDPRIHCNYNGFLTQKRVSGQETTNHCYDHIFNQK